MRLDSLRNAYVRIKPVFYTIFFEIRLHMKKFIVFSVATILLLTINSYIPYVFISSRMLPDSQAFFYEFGTMYFLIILVLAVSFFFGGIISEFKNKTGLEILPLTNRYKLLIGRYIANSILVIGIVTVHYLTMALFGYNFYGGPLLKTLLYSFSFAVLYVFALGSIVTFFSSFLPSPILVIIIISGFILFVDAMMGFLIMGISSELEPLYSLVYLFEIIRYILYPDFFAMERFDPTGRWLFPSIEGAFITLSLYAIIFFLMGSLIFRRRDF